MAYLPKSSRSMGGWDGVADDHPETITDDFVFHDTLSGEDPQQEFETTGLQLDDKIMTGADAEVWQSTSIGNPESKLFAKAESKPEGQGTKDEEADPENDTMHITAEEGLLSERVLDPSTSLPLRDRPAPEQDTASGEGTPLLLGSGEYTISSPLPDPFPDFPLPECLNTTGGAAANGGKSLDGIKEEDLPMPPVEAERGAAAPTTNNDMPPKNSEVENVTLPPQKAYLRTMAIEQKPTTNPKSLRNGRALNTDPHQLGYPPSKCQVNGSPPTELDVAYGRDMHHYGNLEDHNTSIDRGTTRKKGHILTLRMPSAQPTAHNAWDAHQQALEITQQYGQQGMLNTQRRFYRAPASGQTEARDFNNGNFTNYGNTYAPFYTNSMHPPVYGMPQGNPSINPYMYSAAYGNPYFHSNNSTQLGSQVPNGPALNRGTDSHLPLKPKAETEVAGSISDSSYEPARDEDDEIPDGATQSSDDDEPLKTRTVRHRSSSKKSPLLLTLHSDSFEELVNVSDGVDDSELQYMNASPQKPASKTAVELATSITQPISFKLPRYNVEVLTRTSKDDPPAIKVSLPGMIREIVLLSEDHAKQEIHLFKELFLPGQQALQTPDPKPLYATFNFHTICVMILEAYAVHAAGDELTVSAMQRMSAHPQSEKEDDIGDADPDEIFFAVIDRWRVGLAPDSLRKQYQLIRGVQEFCEVALDIIHYIQEHGFVDGSHTIRKERKDKGVKRKKTGMGTGPKMAEEGKTVVKRGPGRPRLSEARPGKDKRKASGPVTTLTPRKKTKTTPKKNPAPIVIE